MPVEPSKPAIRTRRSTPIIRWAPKETSRLIGKRRQYSHLSWPEFQQKGFFPGRSAAALSQHWSAHYTKMDAKSNTSVSSTPKRTLLESAKRTFIASASRPEDLERPRPQKQPRLNESPTPTSSSAGDSQLHSQKHRTSPTGSKSMNQLPANPLTGKGPMLPRYVAAYPDRGKPLEKSTRPSSSARPSPLTQYSSPSSILPNTSSPKSQQLSTAAGHQAHPTQPEKNPTATTKCAPPPARNPSQSPAASTRGEASTPRAASKKPSGPSSAKDGTVSTRQIYLPHNPTITSAPSEGITVSPAGCKDSSAQETTTHSRLIKSESTSTIARAENWSDLMARAFKLYADEREDQEKKLEEASFLTERFQEHAARLIVHRNLIEEQHARSDKQATLTESLAEELKQLKDQSEVRDGQTQDLAAFGKAMKNELATVQRMVDLFIEEVKSGARRISELEEVNQRVESAFARPK